MKNHIEISIVERDLFVSSDMVHTIHSVLPSADCGVFGSIAEARTASQQSNALLLVVISATSGGDLALTKDDAGWLFDRKVIAFDFHDRVAHPGWIYLNKPFAEGDLASAVLTLIRQGVNTRDRITQEAR